MDKAKAAVSDFMHKAGHNDTTVHEKVAPAITQEKISKQRHEEVQTAVDREVHQDHYHTSVQPVKDREVLPEQHSHNIVGVETREHHHGDAAGVKARLEQEAAQFKSTRVEGGTRTTESVAPVIAGEHVHHHVHETIQPVVQKETIQPSVVHTTVPIHEIHENEPKHHSASALPAVSMADFKKQGGSLGGREERYDGFEGEPRAIGGALGGNTTGTHSGAGHHHGNTTAGPHSSNLENKADPRVDSDMSRGTTGTGHGNPTGSGYGNTTGTTGSGYGNTSGTTGSGYGNTTGTTGTGVGHGHNTGTTGTGVGHGQHTGTDDRHGSNTSGTTGKKPSLMDRMNPMKDTDGDGKKGMMD